MKITNKYNLPQPLVDAVKNDGYTKGRADISVTELLEPPQMRRLRVVNSTLLEEDASDRLHSLYGQIVHGILERAEKTAIAERRLTIVVENWKISGGMDRFTVKTGILQDYKFTTAYKVKNGELPKDWVDQTNIYAHILRKNGEDVKSIQIVALYRDWSKLEARRNEDYPQSQVEVLDVPMLDDNFVAHFIQQRVKLHQEAEKDNYPGCSSQERWAKPDVWALMQEGKDRAVKLFYKEEFAKDALDLAPKGRYIQFRPGESVRCKNYCSVAQFCTQNKKENK